jgi:hypothetical protein
MRPEGNCKCGKKATEIILAEGAQGHQLCNICDSCLTKAKEHSRQILEITGLNEFAINPFLRPDDDGKKEKLEDLKMQIGWRAFNELKKGAPLIQWTKSSPHNWFIYGTSVEYLWHSDETKRETPVHLNDLFKCIKGFNGRLEYILEGV